VLLNEALAHTRGELPGRMFRITHFSAETGDAANLRQPPKDTDE
jgi:hypothetical protein